MSYKLYTDWAEKNPHSLVLLEVSDGYISYDEGASALFRLTDQPLQKPNKKEKALGYTIAIPRNYYPILLDDMSKLRISYMVARGDYQVYKCEFEPEYFDAYGKLINFGEKPTDKKFDRGIGLYDTVVIKNLATRKYIVWQIVPEEEASDLGREQSGKISHHSVAGHTLLGHLAGDEVPVSRSDIDNSTYRVVHVQDTKGNNLVKHFKKKSAALQTMQEDEAEALKLIAALKAGELEAEVEDDENKEPQLALTADGKVDISVLLKNKQSSSYDTSHEQIDASEISTEEDDEEEEETLVSLKNYKKKIKKQPEKKEAAPKAAEKPSAPLSGNPEIPGSGPVVWSGVKMPKKKEKVEKELDLVDEKAIEKQQAKDAKKQAAFEKKQAALKEKQKKKEADLKRKQRVQDVKKAAADAKKQAAIDAKAQKELDKKQKEFDKLNQKPKKQKEKKAKKGDLVWGSAEEVAATLGETGEALQGIVAEDLALLNETAENIENVAANAVETITEDVENAVNDVETDVVFDESLNNPVETESDEKISEETVEMIPELDENCAEQEAIDTESELEFLSDEEATDKIVENEGSVDDNANVFDEMFAETDENPFETVPVEETSQDENTEATFGEVSDDVSCDVSAPDAGWNLTGKKQKPKKEKKPFIWPWKRKKMEAAAATALAAENVEEAVTEIADNIAEDIDSNTENDVILDVSTEIINDGEIVSSETTQETISDEDATEEILEDTEEASADMEFIDSLEENNQDNNIFQVDNLDSIFTMDSNPFDDSSDFVTSEEVSNEIEQEGSIDEDFINALADESTEQFDAVGSFEPDVLEDTLEETNDTIDQIMEQAEISDAQISDEDADKFLSEILGISLEQSVFDQINSPSTTPTVITPAQKSGKARRFKTKQRYASKHNR